MRIATPFSIVNALLEGAAARLLRPRSRPPRPPIERLALRSPAAILWAICLTSAAWCQPVVHTVAGGSSGSAASVSATSVGMSTQLSSNLLGDPLGQQYSFGLANVLAVDPSGNLFVSSMGLLYKITPAGIATHIAGTGNIGFSDGHGVALNASFGLVAGLAADANGNVYVADALNLVVWEVNVPNGSIVRIAGIPTPLLTGLGLLNGLESWDSSGDGGPATNAALSPPGGLALDNAGNLYVSTATAIRKIQLSTGIISTLVVTGPYASDVLRQPIVPAEISVIAALILGFTIDPTSSNIYMHGSAQGGGIIDRINLCTGEVSEILNVTPVGGMAFDSAGDLFEADATGIVKIPGGTGTPVLVLPIAGVGENSYPLVVDSSNHLYYGYNQYLEKTNVSGATPAVFAGDGSFNYSGDGPASQASFAFVNGLAADGAGNVYVADSFNNRVRKISLANQTISTVAGTSVPGFNGDGPDATKAQLNLPGCLAVDSAGQNLYIADTGNQRVRQVSLTTGAISTIAAVNPQCIALDGAGHLDILAVAGTLTIDQVTLSTGAMTTLSIKAAGNLLSNLGLGSDSGRRPVRKSVHRRCLLQRRVPDLRRNPHATGQQPDFHGGILRRWRPGG